jgi:hypothetical protein
MNRCLTLFLLSFSLPSIAQTTKPVVHLSLDVPGLYQQVRVAGEVSDGEHIAGGAILSYYHPLGAFPGIRGDIFVRVYMMSPKAPEPYQVPPTCGLYMQAFLGMARHSMHVMAYKPEAEVEKVNFFTEGSGYSIGWQYFFGRDMRWGMDVSLGVQAFTDPPADYHFRKEVSVLRRWRPLGPGAEIVPRGCLVYRLQ